MDFPALNNSGQVFGSFQRRHSSPFPVPWPWSGYFGNAPAAAAPSAAPGGKNPVLFPVPRENRRKKQGKQENSNRSGGNSLGKPRGAQPRRAGLDFPWKTSLISARAENSTGFDPASDPCFPKGSGIPSAAIWGFEGRERILREFRAPWDVPSVPEFPGFAREQEVAAPTHPTPNPKIPIPKNLSLLNPDFSLSAPIPGNASGRTIPILFHGRHPKRIPGAAWKGSGGAGNEALRCCSSSRHSCRIRNSMGTAAKSPSGAAETPLG